MTLPPVEFIEPFYVYIRFRAKMLKSISPNSAMRPPLFLSSLFRLIFFPKSIYDIHSKICRINISYVRIWIFDMSDSIKLQWASTHGVWVVCFGIFQREVAREWESVGGRQHTSISCQSQLTFFMNETIAIRTYTRRYTSHVTSKRSLSFATAADAFLSLDDLFSVPSFRFNFYTSCRNAKHRKLNKGSMSQVSELSYLKIIYFPNEKLTIFKSGERQTRGSWKLTSGDRIETI